MESRLRHLRSRHGHVSHRRHNPTRPSLARQIRRIAGKPRGENEKDTTAEAAGSSAQKHVVVPARTDSIIWSVWDCAANTCKRRARARDHAASEPQLQKVDKCKRHGCRRARRLRPCDNAWHVKCLLQVSAAAIATEKYVQGRRLQGSYTCKRQATASATAANEFDACVVARASNK